MDTPLPLRTEQLASLPLFPLPRTVLLPHTVLALHVFEPRYRQLVDHCTDNGLPVGVPLLVPGHEGLYFDRPPFHETIGVGHIAHVEALSDGRYNILLRGQARVRLDRELEVGHAFRVIEASLLEDVWPEERGTLQEGLGTVRACLGSLAMSRPDAVRAVWSLLERTDDAAIIADSVGSLLLRDPADRQTFLEQTSVEERLDTVVRAMVELVAHQPGPV